MRACTQSDTIGRKDTGGARTREGPTASECGSVPDPGYRANMHVRALCNCERASRGMEDVERSGPQPTLASHPARVPAEGEEGGASVGSREGADPAVISGVEIVEIVPELTTSGPAMRHLPRQTGDGEPVPIRVRRVRSCRRRGRGARARGRRRLRERSGVREKTRATGHLADACGDVPHPLDASRDLLEDTEPPRLGAAGLRGETEGVRAPTESQRVTAEPGGVPPPGARCLDEKVACPPEPVPDMLACERTHAHVNVWGVTVSAVTPADRWAAAAHLPGPSVELESEPAVEPGKNEAPRDLRRDRGVRTLQRAWRARAAGKQAKLTSIELGWRGARAKRLGELAAHVRYVQWVFRAVCALAPGRWRRGRLSPAVLTLVCWCRKPRRSRCRMGTALAAADEFEAQRALADQMLDWYGQYVVVLRRLRSGVIPACYDGFCGGGGWSEGIRRGGGKCEGMDLTDQPDYRRRFGEHFHMGDSTSWSCVAKVRLRHGLRMAVTSPPCQFYSGACSESGQPALISLTRDLLSCQFDYWAVENVMGARRAMSRTAVELDGPFFGLRIFRSRLIETSFATHVDACVREPANALRSRCCLGCRSKWRERDEFGRPWLSSCCEGNVYAPLGTRPWRCTDAECADAMGLDDGHMAYDRLAQAVPPAYGQWVYGQMCMQAAHREYGCPIITFDMLMAHPVIARRTLAQWLSGAGDDNPSAGLAFVGRPARDIGTETANNEVSSLVPDREVAQKGLPRGIGEDGFRELYYAHVGGYDQQFVPGGDAAWLERLVSCRTLSADSVLVAGDLVGHNTYLEVGGEQVEATLVAALEAVVQGGRGTRVTLVAPLAHLERLVAAGMESVDCCLTYGEADYLVRTGRCAVWSGRRASPTHQNTLRHENVRSHMDWRDQGDWKADPDEKGTLSWETMIHNPELWRGRGMPAAVEAVMTEGVRIDMDADASAFETPQHAWPTGAAVVESVLEADRALAVGHMEYVPDDWVERVLRDHIVHPWLMVQQGDKWRLCQDYSGGTNQFSRSAPFGLPSPWDVRAVVKPSSCFAKFDLRDGFWSVPIHPDSRCRLVMRHPATGRLMWCCSLPFGYLDSPRQFCRVTEALTDEMRRRSSGLGVYFWSYVDDFLVVGDDEEKTRVGMRILQGVMTDFGMCVAPQKERGPCRCLEFLGLLLCNVPGQRCIGLTEKRQAKLRVMLDEWSARQPAVGGVARAEPRDLARLLGHLIFASQVIPGGRTYMQCMLSAFSGLEVDWRRGLVRHKTCAWGLVTLRREFWLDLEWWSDHLETLNCMPMGEPLRAEACVTGTDASDWGTGQVLWIDGQREEACLRFGAAERRRPINWRELLGVVRIFELNAERLRDMVVLAETDSMAAKGAAEKLASTAASMQELLRRLFDVAERYNIRIKLTHTPGEKLWRPDQTSRGDAVIEPRVRLVRGAFGALEARFGPFTEFVGAERRHASAGPTMPVDGRTGDRLWVHPAYETVGSALRLLGERMDDCRQDEHRRLSSDDRTGPRVSGVVVVPHDPSATWWKLTGHFRVVGRIYRGDRTQTEMNQLGRWRPVAARRDSLILSFPRSSGGIVAPVILRTGMQGLSHVQAVDSPLAKALPLPVGAVLYSPGTGDCRGELYLVWHGFDPRVQGREVDEEGQLRVSCAELLLAPSRGPKGTAESQTYLLDKRSGKDGSFALGRGIPWEVSADLLWSVDSLVSSDAEASVKNRGGQASPGLSASEVEKRSFTFDWRRGERCIRQALDSASSRAASMQGLEPASASRGDAAMGGLPPHAKTAYRDVQRECQRRGLPAIGTREELTRRLQADVDRRQSDESGTGARATSEVESEVCSPCEPHDAVGLIADGVAELELDDAGAELTLAGGGGTGDAIAGLAAARLSADEAVNLRTQPEREARAAKARPPPRPIPSQTLVPCRYSGMACEGCGGVFTFGQKLAPGFKAFVHPGGSCRTRAGELLRARKQISAEALASQSQTQARGGTALPQARLCEKTSEARLAQAARCLSGDCDGRPEARLQCMRGCGRGVHLVGCLGESAHYAAAGRLVCIECRLEATVASGRACDATAALRRMAAISMCTELTTGAVSTAAGRHQFATLERRWVESMLGPESSPAEVVLPRSSVESFISFMWWLVKDADRARSFATTLRAAGSVMAMQEMTDWTKTARVKAIVKQITTLCNVEVEPCTQTTRRIVGLMVRSTIAQTCRNANAAMGEWLTSRTLALLALELLGGMRVGEATSSGDLHGLSANDLCFSTPTPRAMDDGLGETVEAIVRDSKTGPGRCVAFVATTRTSHLDGGGWMRRWLAAARVHLTVSEENGLKVERPDYWVVRLNVASFTPADMARFARLVTHTLCEGVALHAQATLNYAKRRRGAKNLPSELRYVNIAGGRRDSQEVAGAWAWCTSAGYAGMISIVPGPLIRATLGHSLTHMPLATGSTYAHLVSAIKTAYEESAAMADLDPELDLQGLSVPKFSNHSLRRHADRVARESMHVTGADKQLVDCFFGWLLKEMLKDMQLHYAGEDRPGRRKMACVTMML